MGVGAAVAHRGRALQSVAGVVINDAAHPTHSFGGVTGDDAFQVTGIGDGVIINEYNDGTGGFDDADVARLGQVCFRASVEGPLTTMTSKLL